MRAHSTAIALVAAHASTLRAVTQAGTLRAHTTAIALVATCTPTLCAITQAGTLRAHTTAVALVTACAATLRSTALGTDSIGFTPGTNGLERLTGWCAGRLAERYFLQRWQALVGFTGYLRSDRRGDWGNCARDCGGYRGGFASTWQGSGGHRHPVWGDQAFPPGIHQHITRSPVRPSRLLHQGKPLSIGKGLHLIAPATILLLPGMNYTAALLLAAIQFHCQVAFFGRSSRRGGTGEGFSSGWPRLGTGNHMATDQVSQQGSQPQITDGTIHGESLRADASESWGV